MEWEVNQIKEHIKKCWSRGQFSLWQDLTQAKNRSEIYFGKTWVVILARFWGPNNPNVCIYLIIYFLRFLWVNQKKVFLKCYIAKKGRLV